MVRELSSLLPMLLVLGCCGSEEASSTASVAGRAPKAPAANSQTANTVAKQQPLGKQQEQSEKVGEPAPEKGVSSYPWPPGFELPLEIHVDAPEPPPEIVGPSPPIKEPKKPSEKKAVEPKADEKKSDEKKADEKQPDEQV